MTKEALELALEALTYIYTETTADEDELIDQAITTIKESLAQPEQEPVAWITPDGEGFRIRFSPPVNDVPLGWDALYTTPPKRKPLSVEKILHLVDAHVGVPSMAYPLDNSDWINFARAIEVAHGIKE